MNLEFKVNTGPVDRLIRGVLGLVLIGLAVAGVVAPVYGRQRDG
ncbi:MAG: YgaP-like transmembrane domain [Bacillota bacterium]